MRFVLGVLLPAGFGALSGWLLGASGAGFQIAMALGGVGGVGAGYEHDGWRGGFWRGLVGSVLFALSLVITHEALHVPARAELPAPIRVMAVFYALGGVPLGALGGWLRGRRH